MWYRFLDSFQSFIRKKTKEIKGRRKWGKDWKDKTRPGRVYTRVECVNQPYEANSNQAVAANVWAMMYRIRNEPGWEWNCPNCKEYSIVTESMMPTILKQWQDTVQRMTYTAAAKQVRVTLPPKPTPATAGCTNCRFLPGAPE